MYDTWYGTTNTCMNSIYIASEAQVHQDNSDIEKGSES